MRIKVFQAGDLKEAMEMVKEEFGIDAVILHTKKYKKGGFLGYGSKEIVEVTAAVDDVVKKPSKINKKSVTEGYSLKRQEKNLQEEQGKRVITKPKNMVNSYMLQKNAKPLATTPLTDRKRMNLEDTPIDKDKSPAPTPRLQDFSSLNQMSIQAETSDFLSQKGINKEASFTKNIDYQEDSLKLAKEEKFLELQAEKLQVPKDNREDKIRALEQELAQMKEILSQVITQKEDVKEHLSLKDVLLEQEIEEEIIQDIIRNSPAGTIFLEKDSQNAKAALKNYFQMTIKFTEGINIKKGKQKKVALIGPTGIGKTTTLAKIAAKFILERGIASVLITADTYRISAVEQLKTYSDIIGLPLEIVYSPRELHEAIKKHANKDLILIDTAGRSQHNDYQMQELKELLAVDQNIEKHLVMSATTKQKDAFDIFECFSACKPERILFTKTDETRSIGLILNLLFKHKITLSYLTNGQSVPDDIIPASSEALAELVLR